MYSQIHTDFTSMNSKNSSFQNVIYLRFTLVFSVYARASGIIAGYIGIHPYPSDGVAGIIRTNCSIAPGDLSHGEKHDVSAFMARFASGCRDITRINAQSWNWGMLKGRCLVRAAFATIDFSRFVSLPTDDKFLSISHKNYTNYLPTKQLRQTKLIFN
jgi:hypothetical protein